MVGERERRVVRFLVRTYLSRSICLVVRLWLVIVVSEIEKSEKGWIDIPAQRQLRIRAYIVRCWQYSYVRVVQRVCRRMHERIGVFQ